MRVARGFWPYLSIVASFGCSGSAPARSPTDGGVVLGERAAPPGYEAVGELSVQSGEGCGVFADRGSMEEAESLLRAAAAQRGASYVHVTRVERPKPNHQCLEHEYKLSGTAFRRPASPSPVLAAPTPSGGAPSAASPSLPLTLFDYEGDAPLGKPARESERSSVALALSPGERDGNALSVTYRCSGGPPGDLLDVSYDLGSVDVRRAKALSVRVKPESALSLRVSLIDAERVAHSHQSAPLTAGVWQTVELPLDRFFPGAAAGQTPPRVRALVIAPGTCADARLLVDAIRLE